MIIETVDEDNKVPLIFHSDDARMSGGYDAPIGLVSQVYVKLPKLDNQGLQVDILLKDKINDSGVRSCVK